MTSCFRSIRKQRIEWILVQGASLAWQVNKPCSCRDTLPDCCLTFRSRSPHSSSTLAKIAGSGCLRRRGQGTVRPFHGVGLERINLIALKALEGRPAIGCRHRHHASIALRAPGGVHDKPPFSSFLPNERMEQKFQFQVLFGFQGSMQAAIDHVMHTYGMFGKSDCEQKQTARERTRESLRFPGRRQN